MCGKDLKLINAHIIPNSLREFVGENNNFKNATIQTGKAFNCQTLEFDKHILCKNCDNKLGLYERELKRVLKDYLNSEQIYNEFSNDKISIFETECNSKYVYLALIGILWKFAISTKHGVDLGAKYTPMFKEWLKSKTVPSEYMQACTIQLAGTLVRSQAVEDQLHLIIPNRPLFTRPNRTFQYHLYICGLWIAIHIGPKKLLLPHINKLSIDCSSIRLMLLPFDATIGHRLVTDLHDAIHGRNNTFKFSIPTPI